MKNSGSKNESRIEMIVGIFVVLIFIAFGIFTIMISGATFFREARIEIEVVMSDVMGLRRNDPVIARGTVVGTVSDVFYDRDGVHVKADLKFPVVFYDDYRITIVATSILGGRQLVIHEGTPTMPKVSDVRKLVGEEPLDMMANATEAVSKIRDFLNTDALDNFRKFSVDISDISGRLNRGEGTLGRLLSSDDGVYTNLSATVANLRSITDRLESGEGTLGRLLSSDDGVYTNLSATVANLRSITDRLESGEGTLGRLLSSDDGVYTNLSAAVANLRSITDRLESGEGTLGKLLSSDSGMYDNINGAVSDVRELMDDMREGSALSTVSSLLFSGF